MDSRIDASPYALPHDVNFGPETTALVIMDMQKDCGCFHIALLYVTAAFVLILLYKPKHSRLMVLFS